MKAQKQRVFFLLTLPVLCAMRIAQFVKVGVANHPHGCGAGGKGGERLQQKKKEEGGVNICGATYLSHLFCFLGKVQWVSGLRIERKRQHTTPPKNAKKWLVLDMQIADTMSAEHERNGKLVDLLRPCTIMVKYGGERYTFANFPNAKKGRKFRSIF